MIKTKYGIRILGALTGAVSGYAYWYFWGCTHGCAITSVWWRTMLWGALMGYLIFDLFLDFFKTNALRKTK